MSAGESIGGESPPVPKIRPVRAGKARPAPFSLRLTADERARLLSEAGTIPLGAYIKSRLFGAAPVVRASHKPAPVKDQVALAQVLARLGASRIGNNLNQLAYAANSGSLLIDEEATRKLEEAYADIGIMRRLLVRALRLSDQPPPTAPEPAAPLFAEAARQRGFAL